MNKTLKKNHFNIRLLILIFFSSSLFQFIFAQGLKHSLWNELLSKHVSENGWVNYKAFIQDSNRLNIYLNSLSKKAPTSDWKQDEEMAYWINAYNAFTIQLMIRNPGVNSIKEIGGKFPFINSSWDLKFISIEGKKYDLNNIEHGILRKKFKDPRIHMVLVCASKSCPALLNQAFTADQLQEQMDLCSRRFLSDVTRNIISEKEIKISNIFNWYQGDFDGKKGLFKFIQKYGPVDKLDPKIQIDYLEYDWTLNGQY